MPDAPDNEPSFEDPMDVFRDYPDKRTFSVGVTGLSQFGLEGSVTIEGELPNNVGTSEDDLRKIVVGLFQIMFGPDSEINAPYCTVDGEPDAEAVEAAREVFKRRAEAIATEAQKRAEIASAVINEAAKRRREAGNN